MVRASDVGTKRVKCKPGPELELICPGTKSVSTRQDGWDKSRGPVSHPLFQNPHATSKKSSRRRSHAPSHGAFIAADPKPGSDSCSTYPRPTSTIHLRGQLRPLRWIPTAMTPFNPTATTWCRSVEEGPATVHSLDGRQETCISTPYLGTSDPAMNTVGR